MRESTRAPCVWPDTARPSAARRSTMRSADKILAAIAARARPVIIAGPQLSTVSGRALLAKLEAATGAPAVIMESPRGIADATLGAFPDLIKRADLIVLLGKALDFTTKWATGAGVRSGRADHRHRSGRGAGRARQNGERPSGSLIGCVADSASAGEALLARAGNSAARNSAGSPKRAPRSTTGRRHGAASSRRRQAACIRPRCSARCARSSSAIPTPC